MGAASAFRSTSGDQYDTMITQACISAKKLQHGSTPSPAFVSHTLLPSLVTQDAGIATGRAKYDWTDKSLLLYVEIQECSNYCTD